MFKKNIFGHYLSVRYVLTWLVGLATYPLYNIFNRTTLKGLEGLKDLPQNNVLFVSNHQTYFSDVILMYHAFAAQRVGKSQLCVPWYLINPRLRAYFVAAEETMKAGFVPKLLAYAGAIRIKRTWRESGKSVNRPVNMNDIKNILMGLESGWVITFPQGTTKPFEKGRRGTAHIIKQAKPVVVPVTISGLRRAFDKKGLRMKKRGMRLELTFKPALEIDYDADSDQILEQIMNAIEQTADHNLVPPPRKK